MSQSFTPQLRWKIPCTYRGRAILPNSYEIHDRSHKQYDNTYDESRSFEVQSILITITGRPVSHTILALSSIFNFSSNSASCTQESHSSMATSKRTAKGSKRVNTPLASAIVSLTCSIEKSNIAFMSSMRL